MRILSFNANGLRSAARKGFFDWFHQQDIDIMAVQETKAQAHQLTDALFNPDGYHVHFRDSTLKKGYSGVALYSKQKPDSIHTGLGRPDFDEEGRYIEARFGNLSVVSFYIPSGSSGELRQGVKEDVMQWLAPKLKEWMASSREYVLCGDWNIVRSEKDIKNWKSNQKNSGCLPHERAWMNGMIADVHGDGCAQPEHGWHDSFRVARPHDVEYSWWSQRAGSRGKDVGWRIDYQLLTPGLAAKVKHAQHFREPYFSDHAPYLVDIDWNENA